MGRFPYLDFTGFEKESDKIIIDNILEVMELSHLANKGINEVSGGEAQRAFIGRALVQQPKILLLDEPNSHLDIKHQISIFNLLKKLNVDNGLTIVTVMHDLNLTSIYSSRVAMLKNGEIAIDGNPNETLIPENIEQVFGVNVEIRIDANDSRSIFIKPDLLLN
jgi:iron complex transport system ATP-binding protein